MWRAIICLQSSSNYTNRIPLFVRKLIAFCSSLHSHWKRYINYEDLEFRVMCTSTFNCLFWNRVSHWVSTRLDSVPVLFGIWSHTGSECTDGNTFCRAPATVVDDSHMPIVQNEWSLENQTNSWPLQLRTLTARKVLEGKGRATEACLYSIHIIVCTLLL